MPRPRWTPLLLSTTALVCLTAVAQPARAQRMASTIAGPTFGVVLGVNLANFHGSDASGTDSRTGIIGGVSGTFRLSPVFGIQPELLYSQKGATATVEGLDATFKLSYLEIPVFARVEFSPPSGSVRPFLLAGPSLGLKVGCSLGVSTQGLSASVGCNDVFDEEDGGGISSVDVGAAVGGGLDILMDTWDLSLGVRYDYGLASVMDGSSTKNKAISLLAGVTF